MFLNKCLKYDKTHDLSVIANYNVSKKWKFSSNFTLKSGQPITYADASYGYLDLNIPNFGARNGNRLPTYHRLDVSATYVPKKYETKKNFSYK